MNHKIVTYPALFKPVGDDVYVINFPDIKGAITEGKGLREALKMAADTLASRLCNKKEFPSATDVDFFEEKNDGTFVVKVSADLTEALQDRINYQI